MRAIRVSFLCDENFHMIFSTGKWEYTKVWHMAPISLKGISHQGMNDSLEYSSV